MNYTAKGFLLPEGSEFFTKDHANFNAQKSNDLIEALEASRPERTKAVINYYVDAVNGLDTNTGLSGSPFKTIQKAINMLPQIINHSVLINIAVGTYSEAISIEGFTGKGSISLSGASVATTILTKTIFVTNCTINISSANMKFNGAETAGPVGLLMITNCTYVNFNYATIDGTGIAFAAQNGVYVSQSRVKVSNCTLSALSGAAITSINSEVISSDNAGTGNNVVLKAYEGMIMKVGTQPSGTTAQQTFNGGQIFSEDLTTQINNLGAKKADGTNVVFDGTDVLNYNYENLQKIFSIENPSGIANLPSQVFGCLLYIPHAWGGELIFTSVTPGNVGQKWSNIRNAAGWSGWLKLATTKQGDWITATLQNGWVNIYDYVPTVYNKNDLGIVTVKGMIKDGTIASGTVILNLPSGYRPRASEELPIVAFNASTGNFITMEIMGNGNILILGSTTTGGIRFSTSFVAES